MDQRWLSNLPDASQEEMQPDPDVDALAAASETMVICQRSKKTPEAIEVRRLALALADEPAAKTFARYVQASIDKLPLSEEQKVDIAAHTLTRCKMRPVGQRNGGKIDWYIKFKDGKTARSKPEVKKELARVVESYSLAKQNALVVLPTAETEEELPAAEAEKELPTAEVEEYDTRMLPYTPWGEVAIGNVPSSVKKPTPGKRPASEAPSTVPTARKAQHCDAEVAPGQFKCLCGYIWNDGVQCMDCGA